MARQASPDEFQFHIVRLKVAREVANHIRLDMFQFHIVRLKEDGFLKLMEILMKVSIPYSSIKRLMQINPMMLQNVSIPYSSIKRGNPLRPFSPDVCFNSI